MKMLLMREASTPLSTPGTLWIEDAGLQARFFGYTLEDIVRPDPNPLTPENEAKIPGKTAIPAGEYRVTWSHSQRFQKYLPLLLNVPGFDGVRIHSGNSAEDTEGCILVGLLRGINNPDLILQSRPACSALNDKIREAIERREEVSIRIEDHKF